MYDLGKLIKQLRTEKDVSMDKMCDDFLKKYDVNLVKSTISKWENNRAEPSLSNAKFLADYFNVTLDYILGLEKINVSISEEETTLLENYNKLDTEDKSKVVDYTKLLSNQDKYKVLNTTSDEISATKTNVIEFNKKNNNEEVFIPYQSLDEIDGCNAAHADDLTDEEIKRVKEHLLKLENERALKEWNKKHNK